MKNDEVIFMKNDEVMRIMVRDYTNMAVKITKMLLVNHAVTQRDWDEKDYAYMLEAIHVMRAFEDQILNRSDFLKES